jgi:hypothetical protein
MRTLILAGILGTSVMLAAAPAHASTATISGCVNGTVTDYRNGDEYHGVCPDIEAAKAWVKTMFPGAGEVAVCKSGVHTQDGDGYYLDAGGYRNTCPRL